MALSEVWSGITGPVLHGAISIGMVLVGFLLLVAALTAVFYLLHQYFNEHRGIRRLFRFFTYLTTMMLVAILIVGGLLGLILPVIPGILLLFIALLLLRRYYKNRWIDGHYHRLSSRWKLEEKAQALWARVKGQSKNRKTFKKGRGKARGR